MNPNTELWNCLVCGRGYAVSPTELLAMPPQCPACVPQDFSRGTKIGFALFIFAVAGSFLWLVAR